jgi:hypothetical protein
MLYKKFRLCAQVVGCITIGLLAVYGLVAVLGGGDLVAWASGRAAVAAGNVPSVVNYQGHLKDDSGVPLDGTYDITFRIYDSVSAPTALWTETHSDVTVREGYFNVLLGYSTPLPDDLFVAPDRYIGVTVAPHDEMTPRQRFASVPYAFHAWQVDRAFGLSAADGDPADAVVVDSEGELHVNGDYYGKGHLWLYAKDGDGENGTAYVQARDHSGSSDIDLQFRTQQAGDIKDVMRLTSDGNVHVNGDYYGKGHLWLHAEEGDGENGTAYVQARDHSGSSNIDLQFRTQQAGVYTDVMRLKSDGNVHLNGDLYVAGDITNFSVTDYELLGAAWSPTYMTMKSQYRSICVRWGTAENGEKCRIKRTGEGHWQLVNVGGDDSFACHATCLSW